MKKFIVAAMLLTSGCYTGTAVSRHSATKSRDGVCSKAAAGMFNGIKTCLQTGMPGNLDDDGKTPYIVTQVGGPANSPSANTGNWQIEVWKDGKFLGKARLHDCGVPELSCYAGTCSSWSIDVRSMSEPFAPGTYTFKYTLAFDTSTTAVNTITLY